MWFCISESRSVRQGEPSASWAAVLAAVTVALTSGRSVFKFMHHWSSAKNMTAAGAQFFLRVKFTMQTFTKLLLQWTDLWLIKKKNYRHVSLCDISDIRSFSGSASAICVLCVLPHLYVNGSCNTDEYLSSQRGCLVWSLQQLQQHEATRCIALSGWVSGAQGKCCLWEGNDVGLKWS